MSIYSIDQTSLAELIGETKYLVKPRIVDSTMGIRFLDDRSRYQVTIKDIRTENIVINNDCFLELGDIVVRSYIPTFEYTVFTREIDTGFRYVSKNMVVETRLEDLGMMTTYEQMMQKQQEVLDRIKMEIHRSVNRFQGGEWNMTGVVCILELDVGYTKVENSKNLVRDIAVQAALGSTSDIFR